MQNHQRDNPYEVLGVKKDATMEEIKRAYRKQSISFHPDVNPSPDAQAQFERIKAAYDILSDSDKRRRYDQTAGVDLTKGARAASKDYFRQVFRV